MIHRTMAFGAARLVKACQHSDAFQQRGFTRSVLADDDGDWPVEPQLEIVAQERQTERIGRAVLDALGLEPDPLEVRRRQIDRLASSCHARLSDNRRSPALQSHPNSLA